MKLIFTFLLLLFFSTSFSQWTRVQQLPSSDIFSLYHKDNTLYAGGKNIIYFSKDKGQTWDSTNIIPLLTRVDNIIGYKNELYASSYSSGVYKSPDEGRTWQNITAGIFPFVSDFCEWNGELYASTFGSSVFTLDPINRNSWLNFSSGLSNLSANITSIAGNNNALIAGTLANGLYDYLPVNTSTWEERLLLGRLSPTEGVYDIITARDSLFLSGTTGRFYMSTDNGLNWKIFGSSLPSNTTSLVNARQALLLSRSNFNGVSYTSSFYYISKDFLQGSFVPFSQVQDNYTYKIDILGDKLWHASNGGLFFMSLFDLPGITAADDPEPVVLPIRFISFNANCDKNKVLLTWKTAQEQNSSHFDIERSADGIRWTVINSLPAAGTNNTETSYSFTDNDPVQNSFYRIAGHDLNGRVQYTDVLRSSCNPANTFTLWPNPASDKIFINILIDNASQVMIKIFDGRGALIKMQRAVLVRGTNQLSVDMSSLANGVYTLYADWNTGQIKKTVMVLKQ